jgi:intergrase/recombinase
MVQRPILTGDVEKTLLMLRERRRVIYTLYLVIVYSGVRFEHALQALKTWSPSDALYVRYLNHNIKRLECLETHCRYYVGKELDAKPAAFMFFPQRLLPLIEENREKLPSRHRVYKVVRRLGGLPAKYIRTWAVREMLNALGDNDVTRFILGKFGDLTVSARHYRDLLVEADKVYSSYISHLESLLGGP